MQNTINFIKRNKFFSLMIILLTVFLSTVIFISIASPEKFVMSYKFNDYMNNINVEYTSKGVRLNWDKSNMSDVKSIYLYVNDNISVDITKLDDLTLKYSDYNVPSGNNKYDFVVKLANNRSVSREITKELKLPITTNFNYKLVEGHELGKGIELTLVYTYDTANKLSFPNLNLVDTSDQYFNYYYLETVYEDKGFYNEATTKYFITVNGIKPGDYKIDATYNFEDLDLIKKYTIDFKIK